MRPCRYSAAAAAKSALAWLLVLALLSGAPLDALGQSTRKRKKPSKPTTPPCASCRPATSAPEVTPSSAEYEFAQRDLAELARALHNDAPKAYEKLSAFAGRNSGNALGALAALALGYADFSKNRAPQALAWLERAKTETQLREYVLYWRAQTLRAMKREKEAFAEIETLQREFPSSAMKEQVVDSLASIALDIGKPQEALAALDSYSGTASKTNLLLDRARARQVARQFARAAADYQTLYYKFPLSDEAKPAGGALPSVSRQLGKEYQRPSAELQQHRAQAFFDARKWREARSEFEKLRVTFPKNSVDPLRQRTELRIAQARVQLNASPALIADVNLSDADLDAERLYALSQAWRANKEESRMLPIIDQLLQKYPSSHWAEDAMLAEANYFWVELNRARAAESYKRLLEAFPSTKYAPTAEWRIAWVSYLDRRPEADDLMLSFLRKYPSSSYIANLLYWLGRNAERDGNPARARSYFKKDVERFPLTYFGHVAATRLAQLGSGEDDPIELLGDIPPPPPLRPLDEPIPAGASDRWARAQALRTIALDASAELELKLAYFATASPRMLLEAAQAAFDQGHYGVGMGYARLIVPGSEARKQDEVPLAGWKALYPLPYEDALRREAAKNGLDPYFVAGLIRQESTYQADALSHAGAVGLMQVLPKTGRLLARQVHVHYSRDKLFNPDYNLQLGTVYLKGLIRSLGGPEQALAAYNAGEDRIAAWAAERNYEEVAELVESIPFTETREYVQIVLRNAEAYRMIYGGAAPGTDSGKPTGTGVDRLAVTEKVDRLAVTEKVDRGVYPDQIGAVAQSDDNFRNRYGTDRSANALRQSGAIYRVGDPRDDAPRAEARRGQSLAGLPGLSRARGDQGSRAPSHRRRYQSVRHHLGRQATARRHRREVRTHAGRPG